MDRFQAALAERLENRTDVEFDHVVDAQDASGDDDASGGGSPTSPRISNTAAAQMIRTLREQHEQELEQLLSNGRRNSATAAIENTSFTGLAGKILKQKQQNEEATTTATGTTTVTGAQSKLQALNHSLRRAQDLISASVDPAFKRVAEKASKFHREQQAFCAIVSASSFSRSVLTLQMERRGWTCVAVTRTMELEEQLVEARRKFRQGLGALQFAGRSRIGDSFQQQQPDGDGGDDDQSKSNKSGPLPVPMVRLVILDSFTHELPEESARIARMVVRSVEGGNSHKKSKSSLEKEINEQVAVIQLTQIRSDGGRGLQLPNFVEADRAALDALSKRKPSSSSSPSSPLSQHQDNNNNNSKDDDDDTPPIDMVVKSAFTATLAEKLSSFFLTESARSRARIVSVSSVYDSIRGILGAVSTRRLDGGDKVIGEMYDCFAPSSEIIKKMFEIEKEEASASSSAAAAKSLRGGGGVFGSLRGSVLLKGARKNSNSSITPAATDVPPTSPKKKTPRSPTTKNLPAFPPPETVSPSQGSLAPPAPNRSPLEEGMPPLHQQQQQQQNLSFSLDVDNNNSSAMEQKPAAVTNLSFIGEVHEEHDVDKPDPRSQSIRGGGASSMRRQPTGGGGGGGGGEELTSTALGTVDPSAFLSFETDPRFVVLRAHYHHLRSLMSRFQEEIRGKDRRIRVMQDEIGTLSDEVKGLNASSSGIGVAALLAIPRTTEDTAVGTADDGEMAGGGSWTAERSNLLEKVRRSERRVQQLQAKVSGQANTLAGSGTADQTLRARNMELEERALELTTERDLLKEVADSAQKQLFDMAGSASNRLHSSMRGNPMFANALEAGANSGRGARESSLSVGSDSSFGSFSGGGGRGALVINGSSFSNVAAVVVRLKEQSKRMKRAQSRLDAQRELLRRGEENAMALLDVDANLVKSSSNRNITSSSSSRRSAAQPQQHARRGDSSLSVATTGRRAATERSHFSAFSEEENDADAAENDAQSAGDAEQVADDAGDSEHAATTSRGNRGRARRGVAEASRRGGGGATAPTAASRRRQQQQQQQQKQQQQQSRRGTTKSDAAGRNDDEKHSDDDDVYEPEENHNLVPSGVDPSLLEDGSYRYPADQDEKLDEAARRNKLLRSSSTRKDAYGRTNSLVLLNNIVKEKERDRRRKQKRSKHRRSGGGGGISLNGVAHTTSDNDNDDDDADGESLDSNDRRHRHVEISMHDAAQKLHGLADSLDAMFQRVVDYTEKAAAARREGLSELFEAVAQVSERCTKVNDATRIDGLRLEIDSVQQQLDGILSRPLGPEQGSMAALRAKGDDFFRLYVRRHHLVADLRRLEENCNIHTHSRVKEHLLRRLLTAQARLDEVGNYLLNNNELFMYAESRMDVHRLLQELAPWITQDEFELLQREGKSAVTEMITKCQMARNMVESNEAERSLNSNTNNNNNSDSLARQQSIANPAVGSSGAGRRRLSLSIAAFERTAKMLQQGDVEDEGNDSSSPLAQSGSFRFRVKQQQRQQNRMQQQHRQSGGVGLDSSSMMMSMGYQNPDGTPFEPVAAAAKDLDKDISRFVLDESVDGLRGILKHLLEMWTTDRVDGGGIINNNNNNISVTSPHASPPNSPTTRGLSTAPSSKSRRKSSPTGGGSPRVETSSFGAPAAAASSTSPLSPNLLKNYDPASASRKQQQQQQNDDEQSSLHYIINNWKSDAMRLVLDCAYDVNTAINEFIEKEKAAQTFIETAGFDIRPHNRRIVEKLLHDPFAADGDGGSISKPLVDPSATNVRIVSVVEAFREASLVMHGQLKRLMLELKRRTPLTKVKIVDYAAEKMLYRKKRLRQVSEFPALMTVDAALIGRFADYFEDETKGQYLLARAAFKKKSGEMMKNVKTQTTALGALVDKAHLHLTVEQQQQLLMSKSSGGGGGGGRSPSASLAASLSATGTGSRTPFQAAIASLNAGAPPPPDLLLNAKQQQHQYGKRNGLAAAADQQSTTPLAHGTLSTPAAPGHLANFGADGTIQISFGRSGADTSALNSPSSHLSPASIAAAAANERTPDDSESKNEEEEDDDDDAEYEIEYDESGNVVSKTKIKQKVALPPLLLLRQQQLKEEARLREVELEKQKRSAPKTDEAVAIINAAAASAEEMLHLPDIYAKNSNNVSAFSASYRPKETETERREQRRVKPDEGAKSDDQTLVVAAVEATTEMSTRQLVLDSKKKARTASDARFVDQTLQQQQQPPKQQQPKIRHSAPTAASTSSSSAPLVSVSPPPPPAPKQQQQHHQTPPVATVVAVPQSPPPPPAPHAPATKFHYAPRPLPPQEIDGVMQQSPDPQHLPWSARTQSAQHATANRTTVSSGHVSTTTLGDGSATAGGGGRVPPALPGMRQPQQIITTRQMAMASTARSSGGDGRTVAPPRSSGLGAQQQQQQYRLVVVRDTDAMQLPRAVPSPPQPRR